MTTPERGLFDEVEGYIENGRSFVQEICERFEQRLSEAEERASGIEEKYWAVALQHDKLLIDGRHKDTEIAQLRARCGELEQKVELVTVDGKNYHVGDVRQLVNRCGELEKIAHKANAVNAHWNEFGYEHGFDERMDHLHSVLTATPQPAQEQVKCKNCNGKGWTWLAGAPAHETNKYPCEECNLQGHQL